MTINLPIENIEIFNYDSGKNKSNIYNMPYNMPYKPVLTSLNWSIDWS